jgi:hypothetical protein
VKRGISIPDTNITRWLESLPVGRHAVPLLRRMLKGNALHLGWAMPLEVEGFLVDEGFAHISIFFFPPNP